MQIKGFSIFPDRNPIRNMITEKCNQNGITALLMANKASKTFTHRKQIVSQSDN